MKEFIKKFTPQWLLGFYHFILAFFGALIYGFPSRKLKVIGVTGTNGKTTTTEMIAKIFEEAGFKIALLNSIRFKIAEREEINTLRMTMPGRFFIQRFLRRAVNSGCQYAILEVTSEGIKQHRHRFIDFDIAVFTNLAPEHIESHGSFEKYREAKEKLFSVTKKVHIINLDDENVEYFLQFPAKRKFCYSTDENLNIESLKIHWKLNATQPPPFHFHGPLGNWKFIKATSVNVSVNGLDFKIESTPFHLKLLGGFNVFNSLAAICVAGSQGINLKTGKSALEKVEKIPGRMELVISKPFKVFVDYAFTPNALRKIYETLLNSKFRIQNSKLICVLGACGGGRDKWKRPVLGEIAAKCCDKIIITNEDPYDENPFQILSMIKSGISNAKFQMSNLYEILDRRKAIKRSLEIAKPDDIVIITGKGCEPSICLAGGKKIPWDDREIVRKQIHELKIENEKLQFKI